MRQSVYLANQSIDMIDAVNKGYQQGRADALEELFNLAKDNSYDDAIEYSIGLQKLDELITKLKEYENMTKYYDVVLINRKRNRKVSYLADSFSVNADRILKIKSRDYGDILVQIESEEELTVNEVELTDISDDISFSDFNTELKENIDKLEKYDKGADN